MTDIMLITCSNGRMKLEKSHYKFVKSKLSEQRLLPCATYGESVGEYIFVDHDNKILVNAQTTFAFDKRLRNNYKKWLVVERI
jgi:hypothetical protein